MLNPDRHNTSQQVLAGPILRKTTPNEVTLWLATREKFAINVRLVDDTGQLINSQQTRRCITAGEHLFIHFIQLSPDDIFPCDTWIGYQIDLIDQDQQIAEIQQWGAKLFYPGKQSPGFVIQSKVSQLLHGSCRKPHFASSNNTDGLALVDSLLATTHPLDWPALLILSGDQIYADDVAGPMLHAIHQLIQELGLPSEALKETSLTKEQDLQSNAPFYYQRDNLLPQTEETAALQKQFFGGVKKPIFTTTTAQNHLMTLSEMLAMYLLVWSPAGWQNIELSCPTSLTEEDHKDKYNKEKATIIAFQQQLDAVQRAMAHLPTAMIFDDHDVTDDWNLTAAWEKSAYQHPMSRRIIGNALIGYFLCQGWGNAPEKFDSPFIDQIEKSLQNTGSKHHDACIDQLLKFENWHYQWPTQPPLIVLDTRTRRWRSEKNIKRPSGLMDWEALIDLQSNLMEKPSVILISPAPIFGVKLIESIQKLFTLAGKPLMVDAENWMAHPGSAHTLMNLFKHPKTPQNFVILSGDVHYSFAYDIEIKGRKNSPNIWQITSSGLRNEFPAKLLDWFDRLNRWLYAPWSPLNLFTKRRGMWVSPRKPDQAGHGERLLNHSGIGLVTLDDKGKPSSIQQIISADQVISFDKLDHAKQFE
ncbi:alkaline phosphatase D family protein [Marinomonas sp.]